MITKKRLFIFSILFFFIGASVIIDFFSFEPIEIAELSTNGLAYDGRAIEVLGYLSPSQLQLDKKVSFEEEVFTYVLENEGGNLLVISPEAADGFVFVRGRYIVPDPTLEVSSFIYAAELRGAWNIEELGLTKEGLLILAFYSVSSVAAFLYEFEHGKNLL